MRFSPVILLICLLMVGNASAAYTRLNTINFQAETTNVPCSQDTYQAWPDATVIWIIPLADPFPSPDIFTIDGKVPQGTWPIPEQGGNKIDILFVVTPGPHTLVIQPAGYSPFTATVQTCDKKVSYVYYNLAAHAVTTAPATTVTTAVPITTVTTEPGVTTPESQPVTQPTAVPDGPAPGQETLGNLSVTTTPPGVSIFIDGIRRGVSPATIPGITAGSHALLLQLDGYEDLSTPVTISAGKTQAYSTAMIRNGVADAPAATEPMNAPATNEKAPGFESAYAVLSLGTILLMRRRR